MQQRVDSTLQEIYLSEKKEIEERQNALPKATAELEKNIHKYMEIFGEEPYDKKFDVNFEPTDKEIKILEKIYLTVVGISNSTIIKKKL